MNTQASFALRGRNPDVLTCIANLSNDEVFTPPELANKMLDTLTEAWAAAHTGANIWADKSIEKRSVRIFSSERQNDGKTIQDGGAMGRR